jgi:hypothetical protein
MDHGLHDNKRRRLLQPVPSTRRPSSGSSGTSSTSGTSGIWYAAVAVPCRVCLMANPAWPVTVTSLASSRYQRPHAPPPQPSHHSTIPRRHVMIQAIMLRLTPLDAGALPPRTSNLGPHQHAGTPSVCFPLAPAASGAACVCITPNAATRFRCASPMAPLSHTPTAPCLGRQLHASLGRLPLRAKSPSPSTLTATAFHASTCMHSSSPSQPLHIPVPTQLNTFVQHSLLACTTSP